MEVQVLGTHWDGPDLVILGADEGGHIHRLDWQGALDWTVTGPATCVGRVEDGPGGPHHVPCPTREEVHRFPRCAACEPLESPECIFEPRGQEDAEHHCALCDRPHVVYAAFHGVLAKVGMTGAHRVATRLREQGADAWFVIAEAADRAEARRIERQVAFLYRIPEWRTHRETLPQLVRPVEWERIAERADDLRARLSDRFDPELVLHRIEDVPLPAPLPLRPQRIPPWGRHRGKWIGAKGMHLFYEAAPEPGRLDVGRGPIHALKRTDLVGCRITVA